MDPETTSPRRVAVVGEALVDLVPVAGDEAGDYRARLGGSPYNVAIGLARLGVATSLKARLSGDPLGRRLRRHAEDEGVGLDHAPVAAEPTTLALLTLDEAGRADYGFYVAGTADWPWTESELAPVPAGTAIAHFGSLASWLPPSEAPIRAWVAGVRASGVLTSYDPNVRPRLQRDRGAALAAIEANVAVADIVKASADDVAWLYPGRVVEDVAETWLGLGSSLVVVTDGPRGARAWSPGGGTVSRPAPRVAVEDTVGAGDAFTSGLLSGLLEHDSVSAAHLAAIELDTLGRLLDRAIQVAALTCTREGADPPRRDELSPAPMSGGR